MRRHAVLLVVVLVAACVAPARAADTTIGAVANKFVPGDVTISEGSKLTFANTDLAPHNVVSDALGRNGPIFRSTTVTTGQTAEVTGVPGLKPGVFTFYCSVHPEMRGTLSVTGSAAPAATVATPTGGSVPTPTSLTFHRGSIYVTSYAAGTVTVFPVLPGGLLGAGTPYATGLDSPLGLVFGPDGTLYVADSRAAADRRYGRVWAVKPDGTKQVLVDGLPNGRHNTNNLTVRGSRLYVTNGNSTDDGVAGGPPETPLSGTVLSYPLPLKKGAKPTVEARGLRNVYDVAFRPGTSEAWFASNGPDALDPYGEDLLHKADVAKSAPHFGFPACVYNAAGQVKQNPAVKARCGRHTKPEIPLGLHVSANGLAFGTGGVWGNDLYIAEYGSNVPSPSGHRVVRVPVVKGRAGTPVDVMAGSAPIDVTFGPDGLYVLDFVTGTITLLRGVA